MENQLDFYRSFHTHPINQNIHTVCIPAIVLCVLNYTSLIRIHFEFLKGNGKGKFTPITPMKSGFYTNGDVKDLIPITINSQKYIISAKNNDYLQFIKIN